MVNARRKALLQRLYNAKIAHDDLLSYVRFTMPDAKDPAPNPRTRYLTGRHHELMARKLHELEAGKIKRMILNLGPRHGKTELASKRFVSWWSGRHPEQSLILGTYNEVYAGDIGRAVRDNIQGHEHRLVFPDHGLKVGSEAAQRLETLEGGQLSFVGRGGSITGRGGHGLVIDDPIKDRKEADSALIRDQLWDWFNQVIGTRMMTSDAWIMLIQCMTGDTPVMLPDGTEKPLDQIRPGDMVASYDHGHLSAARVLKHRSQGADYVYAIKTKSGIVVRANGRHPFLVEEDGVLGWRQAATLKKGASILRVIGGSGAESRAANPAATVPQSVKDFARRTITSADGLTAFARLLPTRPHVARRIFDTATALTLRSMNVCSTPKMAGAPSAALPLPNWLLPTIGAELCAWITAMMADMSADCSATRAISPSGMAAPRNAYGPPLPTLSVTLDEVESVTPAGRAEVFDLQIENTENFIAGGLVSHNTRWHEDDLVGRLTDPLNPFYSAEEAAQWAVVDLPAIALEDDPLNRKPGEALWPERFPVKFLEEQQRRDPRGFQALYQGRPSPATGTFFHVDWLKTYRQNELPPNLRIYAASDHAVSTQQYRDKTVLILAGVAENGDIYVLPNLFWRAASADVVTDAMLNMIREHKPLFWWAERGHISKAIGPFLRRRMAEEAVYGAISEVTPVADKQTRAQSIQGRMAMGKVYFPSFAPWWPEAKSQLLKFPFGAHDDFVDALAYIGLGLANMVSPDRPLPQADVGAPGSFRNMFYRLRQTQAADRRKKAQEGW